MNNYFKKGFTLIELVVSSAVFTIMIGAVTVIFLSSLMGQRRSIAFEGIFDQASFLMEYMSRSLRMAKRQTVDLPACLSANNRNYEITRSGRGIKFINSQNICQEFFLDLSTSRMKEAKDGQEQYLTAEKAEVVSFNLNVLDQVGIQPRATFILAIKNRSLKAEAAALMKFQATVSQRKLNIQ